MNYIDTQTNEYPVTQLAIQQANPNTSFSVPFDASPRYMPVALSTGPMLDPMRQKAVEVAPALVDGVWTQQWTIVPLSDEEALARAKAHRTALVAAITVTTASGKVFDGNEDAQNRMSRAINGMDDADQLPWVLHDNTVAVVDKAEMREALRLAGAAMAAIWVAPYTQP